MNFCRIFFAPTVSISDVFKSARCMHTHRAIETMSLGGGGAVDDDAGLELGMGMGMGSVIDEDLLMGVGSDYTAAYDAENEELEEVAGRRLTIQIPSPG